PRRPVPLLELGEELLQLAVAGEDAAHQGLVAGDEDREEVALGIAEELPQPLDAQARLLQPPGAGLEVALLAPGDPELGGGQDGEERQEDQLGAHQLAGQPHLDPSSRRVRRVIASGETSSSGPSRGTSRSRTREWRGAPRPSRPPPPAPRAAAGRWGGGRARRAG